MQKVLHLNADKCTGCLQCEMACSFENYGVYAPAKSRIKVFDFHATGKKVPYTCTQCDEAWCLHACPVEAITIDRLSGAKVVSESTCVGCKACRKRARCRSATSASTALRGLPAWRPARPPPSPTSTPTGPAWTA